MMLRILVLMAMVPVLGVASCGRSESGGGAGGAGAAGAAGSGAGVTAAAGGDSDAQATGGGERVEESAVGLASGGTADKESNVEVILPGDRLPMPKDDFELASESEIREAVVAGGCFWCTEAVYELIEGVGDVVSGYCGGSAATADYRTVSSGRTMHAEAIRISYDASKITYGGLLRVFFAAHDPTQLNRQGPDTGPQYRSAIFYSNEDEKRVAEAYIKQLTEATAFSRPIVTTIEENTGFYDAEDYHQDYARRNPNAGYIEAISDPKVDKVLHKYQDLIKFDLRGEK